MQQNNSTELLGHSFIKIYSKNSPPGSPRPQIRIVYRFYQICCGNSVVFGLLGWSLSWLSKICLKSGHSWPFRQISRRFDLELPSLSLPILSAKMIGQKHILVGKQMKSIKRMRAENALKWSRIAFWKSLFQGQYILKYGFNFGVFLVFGTEDP